MPPAYKVRKVPLELQVSKVPKVKQVMQEYREQEEIKDRSEQLEHLEQTEQPVRKALWQQQGRLVFRARLEPLALLVPKVNRVVQEILARLEPLGTLDSLVRQALRDNRDQKGP